MKREDSGDLRLRAAVESSPSGLLMIDAEGRIVLVNREIERLFGYPREELLGRPVETLVPQRYHDAHPGFRRGFFGSPSVRAMGAGRELYGVRKDGTELPVEIGLTPVVTDEGLFVISSIVDISARKAEEVERGELEEQLRQSQKLEAVGRLAGGIAHDFNNILASIFGYAELARDATNQPEVSGDLDQLLRSARRGRELVERILRFSRRQPVERRPIELAPTIAEATGLLRSTLPAAIELRLDLERAPERILGDPTSIHQVMMNLITNAVDAMPSGGQVEIHAEPFYVRDSFARAHPGLREGAYALLSVRDDGSGMDEATLARAFEPFYTTKEAGRGSGLGLAMVHGIVRDHGGAVWLDSSVGLGTIASVLLPVAEAEPERELSAVAEAARGTGERVLIVDDEPSLVEIGRRRLVGLGYRATVAWSAEEALSLFHATPELFDIVITDYSMPRTNGVELARKLSRLRPGLPILLVTGYIDDFSDENLAASGVRGVLKKPLTARELGTAVRAALDDDADDGRRPS